MNKSNSKNRNDDLVTPSVGRSPGDMAAFMGGMNVSIGKDQGVSHGNGDVTAPIRKVVPKTE